MIHLIKGATPDVLVRNAAAWTRELENAIAQGAEKKRIDALKSRYRHDDVKAALTAETHGKCAYCESKLLHIAYGDIEHIVPKDGSPARTFEWENLTLACDVCNTKKSIHQNLVDPYDGDPELVFTFRGPMVFHQQGNGNAERTKSFLELNRTELLERRHERLSGIEGKLSRLTECQDPAVRTMLRAEILDHETKANREYAACVRALVTDLRNRGQL